MKCEEKEQNKPDYLLNVVNCSALRGEAVHQELSVHVSALENFGYLRDSKQPQPGKQFQKGLTRCITVRTNDQLGEKERDHWEEVCDEEGAQVASGHFFELFLPHVIVGANSLIAFHYALLVLAATTFSKDWKNPAAIRILARICLNEESEDL